MNLRKLSRILKRPMARPGKLLDILSGNEINLRAAERC